MKIDPYKHKETFLNWKASVQSGIPEIKKANSDIILKYITDMEKGINISTNSVKGSRSYTRLNNLRLRLVFMTKRFEQLFNAAMTELNEEQLFEFFDSMRNGVIRQKNGKSYKSVADYVKVFKAFWHWYMKVCLKQEITIGDITQDLDTSRTKPKWVYLTEDQIRKLCDNTRPEYKVLIMFMYDTGIRSPTELINVRVYDLYDHCKKVHIRDEIVKKGSFGRKVNLMLCSDLIKRYIADNKLQPNDQLFKISPPVVNRYLKRLAKRVLGDGISQAGESYDKLTMYDFRHCSCCYWLPRYKSESALKYRFGWRKSDKIHYYSELLGMKDTITEEDMLMDLTKTEIEKRLLKTERENEILKEKLDGNDSEIRQVKALMKIFVGKFQQLEELGLLFNAKEQKIA